MEDVYIIIALMISEIIIGGVVLFRIVKIRRYGHLGRGAIVIYGLVFLWALILVA